MILDHSYAHPICNGDWEYACRLIAQRTKIIQTGKRSAVLESISAPHHAQTRVASR